MKWSTFTLNGNLKYSESTLKIAKMWGCFENPFVNDSSLDPRPLPFLHMRRRYSALCYMACVHSYSVVKYVQKTFQESLKLPYLFD